LYPVSFLSFFIETGITVFIEYAPEHKEGVVTEKFELVSESDAKEKLTVLLHMEILGNFVLGSIFLMYRLHCTAQQQLAFLDAHLPSSTLVQLGKNRGDQ